jgi:hypothetical protein|tara:strand:+ start:410 stop:631 length:222 start_codon:yes stop_codon:yes gene_type:complete
MNKKDILIKELETIGIIDPVVRWIPNNPMGRKTGKVTGWVFRSYEDKLWQKLGDNFESAKAEAQNIAIVSSTK